MKKITTILLIFSVLTISLPISYVSAKSENANNQSQTKQNSSNKQTSKNTQSKDNSKKTTDTNVSLEYGFEVAELSLPETMKAGEIVNTQLTIKNTSNFDWDSKGNNDVQLAYHWIDSNGQFEVYRTDTTSVHKVIKQDQTTTQKFQVRAPSIPGNFTFAFDMTMSDKWFTNESNSKFEISINVTGEIDIYDEKGILIVNPVLQEDGTSIGAEYTNKPNLTLGIGELSFQPGSENAAFVYEYVQGGIQMDTESSNVGDWGKWLSINNQEASYDSGINEPFAGLIKVFGRFRAFKKHSTATPDSYGSAMYHYGRSAKTTGTWWDEIFFDNIPPEGSITINNGASSTTSRTVSLQISATDNLLGMTGSGLDGMRLDLNCDGNWGGWEEVSGKSGITLSGSSQLKACVQFRDKAGNASEVYSDQITYYVPYYRSGSVLGGSYGFGIGTPDNKFASKTADDLRKPWIEFDRFIDIFGASKWNNTKLWDMPEPIITYVDRVGEYKVELSGIAVKKWNPVDVIINNEYRYCFLCGSDWEWFKEERSIEHSKVQIFKADGTLLKEFWNDDPLGRWQITLDLGSNLSESDLIYAKSYTYGKHYFDNLKWWSDTTEDNIEFVGWDLWSGDSEKMEIPRYVDLLKAQISNDYGLDTIDGFGTWKSSELQDLIEMLNDVPAGYYSHSHISSLKREGASDDKYGIYYPSTGEMAFYDGMFRNFSTRFTDYGFVDGETYTKLVFVHEMAHAWEEYDKESGSQVLRPFADISWRKTDQPHELWLRDLSAQKTIVDYDLQKITYYDFANDYASDYSYEDWAEAVAVQRYLPEIFDKGTTILKSKQTYAQIPFQ